MSSKACPCQSGLAYDACCGQYHRGALAPTVEALMRSRYSAFALGNWAYLRQTWAPEKCPSDLEESEVLPWIRLTVKEAREDGEVGFVRFRAVARTRHGALVHEELSRFERRDGAWLYVDEVKED